MESAALKNQSAWSRLLLFLREVAGWASVSLITGLFGGGFVFVLDRGLGWCAGLRGGIPPWIVWALPAAGGALVGLALWKLGRGAEGEPMPKYIRAVNRAGGVIPFAHGAAAFLGSFVTIGTGGSGGTIGPAVLASSYLSSALGGRSGGLLGFFNMAESGRQRFAVCAAAAAISAILRAPVGGGILAVELLFRKNLDYQRLFAAMLSSVSGYLVFGALGGDFAPLFDRPGQTVPGLGMVPWVLGLVLAVVVMSLGFVWLYEKTYRLASRMRLPPPARLALGGLFVGLTALGLYFAGGEDGTQVMGTSKAFMLKVVSMDHARAVLADPEARVALWFVAVFLVAKLAATCVTVGTGNVAGFVMPTLLLGAFAGHLCAGLAGWNAAENVTEHAALLCAGIAAALAATINCPLAAIIIGLELFGLRFAWVSAVSALVAYKLTQDRAVYQLGLGARRVLVADDDANLRRIVAKLFSHAGYEVEEAANGGEAIEKLAAGEVPDLVILDRQMPVMSGEEVLARIRGGAATAALPVIMLTARGAEEEVIEGLESGADDYVSKPFRQKELLARADRLLTRARSHEGAVLKRD